MLDFGVCGLGILCYVMLGKGWLIEGCGVYCGSRFGFCHVKVCQVISW